MQEKEFHWRAKTGEKVYARSWEPNTTPKAVICLVHGLGEHCSRYQHLADFFVDQGFAVVANDHLGHGKTEGKRGHGAKFEHFMDNVGRLLEEGDSRFPGVPVILYGHSMGGNFVLNYLLRRKPKIAGVIATGPWIKLGFEPPAYLVFLGKLTRKLAPSFAQKNSLDTSKLSHDKAVVDKYINDPLVHDRVTSSMGMEMLDAAKWLQDNAGKIDVPLLLMHGSSDEITSPKGTEEFAKKATGDITLKLWDGWYHEIHNEIGKEEFFAYTLNWIQQKL